MTRHRIGEFIQKCVSGEDAGLSIGQWPRIRGKNGTVLGLVTEDWSCARGMGRRPFTMAPVLPLAILVLCASISYGQAGPSNIDNGPVTVVFESAQTHPDAAIQHFGESYEASPTSDQSAAASNESSKRILGIVPNFQTVNTDVILPPQTVKEKFKTGLQDSFDYSSFVFVGIQAGISQATDSYPAFRQGAAGYGRYYWHTFADQTDENLLVESVIPSILHQDSRYYTLGHGGFLKRTVYSFSRAFITRTDHGAETFNASEILGSGAAAGISSAYYPDQYRTWTKTGQRWLTNAILDSLSNVAREFWPDIDRVIFHHVDPPEIPSR
jgi:hypothetical protein